MYCILRQFAWYNFVLLGPESWVGRVCSDYWVIWSTWGRSFFYKGGSWVSCMAWSSVSEYIWYVHVLLTFSSFSSNFLWKFFCSLSAYRILYDDITHVAPYVHVHVVQMYALQAHTYTLTISLKTFKSFSALLRNSSIWITRVIRVYIIYTSVSTHPYMTIQGTSVHLSCSSLWLFKFWLKFRVRQFITVRM